MSENIVTVPYKPLAVITAGTMILAVAMWLAGHSYFAFWDTQTYIEAFGNILRHGADAIRTPIYPLIVGFCRLLPGEMTWAYVLIILQLGAFAATIPVMWRVAARLMSARAALITTAAYAWCPTFVSFAMFVMPDIWCVIGVTVLLAQAQKMAECCGYKALTWCVFVSVALVLLKPSNIYIAIWWAVVAAALLLRRNRRWWYGLVPACAMTVVLGGYGLAVQRITGYYTISVVSDINDLGNIAQRRKLVPELAPDSATADLFRRINAADTVSNHQRRRMAFLGTESLTYAQIHAVMSATKSYDPARWYLGIPARLFESMPSNAFPIHGSDRLKYYTKALHISFYVVYVVILALFVWLCAARRRCGEDSRHSLFRLSQLWALWVLVCGGIATAIIGGFDDYGRLAMGVYPALMLLCGAVLAAPPATER